MADQTSVSGTVKVEDGSKERVAFDLMKFIRNAGEDKQDEILELYARCLLTASSPTLGQARIKQSVKGQ